MQSRLTLAELGAADAGEYTCTAGDKAATLHLTLYDDGKINQILRELQSTVHFSSADCYIVCIVAAEDHAEAMQRDEAGAGAAGRARGQGGALLALPLLALLAKRALNPP